MPVIHQCWLRAFSTLFLNAYLLVLVYWISLPGFTLDWISYTPNFLSVTTFSSGILAGGGFSGVFGFSGSGSFGGSFGGYTVIVAFGKI
jgi:hypothetical protein